MHQGVTVVSKVANVQNILMALINKNCPISGFTLGSLLQILREDVQLLNLVIGILDIGISVSTAKQ